LIIFKKDHEKPRAQPSSTQKIRIQHRGHAIKYCERLRDRAIELEPILDYFDEAAGQNCTAIIASLENLVEQIQNDRVDPIVCRIRFPHQFHLILRSVLSVGDSKKPLFENLDDISSYMAEQQRIRIQKQEERAIEEKRLRQEAEIRAADAARKSKAQQLASQLGIKPAMLEKLQKGEI
jgi:hypothetical protein